MAKPDPVNDPEKDPLTEDKYKPPKISCEDPLTFKLEEKWIPSDAVTSNLLALISNDPVNLCKSSIVSPNLLDPLAYLIDELTNSVWNSLAVTDPLVVIFPLTNKLL